MDSNLFQSHTLYQKNENENLSPRNGNSKLIFDPLKRAHPGSRSPVRISRKTDRVFMVHQSLELLSPPGSIRLKFGKANDVRVPSFPPCCPANEFPRRVTLRMRSIDAFRVVCARIPLFRLARLRTDRRRLACGRWDVNHFFLRMLLSRYPLDRSQNAKVRPIATNFASGSKKTSWNSYEVLIRTGFKKIFFTLPSCLTFDLFTLILKPCVKYSINELVMIVNYSLL